MVQLLRGIPIPIRNKSLKNIATDGDQLVHAKSFNPYQQSVELACQK